MDSLPRPPVDLRDRAAQLVFPRIGSNMPPSLWADEDADRVLRLMDAAAIGGLCLFRGRMASTPDALMRLQEAARFPLLVCSDLERGAGQQMLGASVFPHAAAFGANGPEAAELTRRAACMTAQEALALGVHWLLAPVADVHSNPSNPIIATRAFARTPDAVGELVRSFVEGSRQGGALSTAKHFPGHGDTEMDSHDGLPVMNGDRARLEAVELAPFRSAIAAGVDAIMTAHVAYTAFDHADTPATASARILRDLLRRDLGFTGVVVSDSLLMGGAGADGDLVSRQAPRLIQAGIDVLLDVKDPLAAVDSIVRAVEGGILDEALLQEAVDRVWSLKMKLIDRFGSGAFTSPPAFAAVDAAHELADTVAEGALSVSGDVPEGLMDRIGAGTCPVIVIRPHTSYPDPTRSDAESVFARLLEGSRVLAIGPDSSERDFVSAIGLAREAGCCVVAMVVKPAAWHRFGLRKNQARFVRELVDCSDAVLITLGSDDVLGPFPGASAVIRAFSDVEPTVRAVARWLGRA